MMRITINRKSEWDRALLDGIAADGHVLRGTVSGSMVSSAKMITGSIDSFEHDHLWDEVFFDMSISPNSRCTVSYYTSNTKLTDSDADVIDFDKWLRNSKKTPAACFDKTDGIFTPVKVTDGYGLLKSRGRYLWLKLEIVTQAREEFELRSIGLNLPDESIVDYLPEVYRKGLDDGDFFLRFMSVFNSIFFTFEDAINNTGGKLDYRTADEDMLLQLASWLKVDTRGAFGEALRNKIAKAAGEYKMSGTKAGLISMVESMTGYKPLVVEHFQVEKMINEGRDRNTYRALFGFNPYKIHVIIDESALKSRVKSAALAERIRSYIPANVEFEIVPLRGYIHLDNHTYLEVNSCLGDYSSMVVEKRSALYHDTYIG